MREEYSVRKLWVLPAALVLLLLLCGAALAGEARDIAAACTFKGSLNPKMVANIADRDYGTYWRSQPGAKACLEVTLPKGETCAAVYIKWGRQGTSFRIRAEGLDVVAEGDSGLFADYVPLPREVTSFQIVPGEKERDRLVIVELYVFTPGDVPDDVQRWRPAPDKADILVLFAHPDDEVLFMGGTIPYYAGEMKKQVVAACVVPTSAGRSLELLDSLWLCGLRNYPSFGPMRDNFSMSLEGMYGKWRKEKLYDYVVDLYRRYKPNVVVSHDVNGEYGHGAHRAAADAAQVAVKWAANPRRFPGSVKEYGVWEIQKLYLHLYRENTVDMDWRRPLHAFGGKTAFDMAQAGFACHKSQQDTEYKVEDSGPYDNSLFGLAYTKVGPDADKNDFLEHVKGAKQ